MDGLGHRNPIQIPAKPSGLVLSQTNVNLVLLSRSNPVPSDLHPTHTPLPPPPPPLPSLTFSVILVKSPVAGLKTPSRKNLVMLPREAFRGCLSSRLSLFQRETQTHRDHIANYGLGHDRTN